MNYTSTGARCAGKSWFGAIVTLGFAKDWKKDVLYACEDKVRGLALLNQMWDAYFPDCQFKMTEVEAGIRVMRVLEGVGPSKLLMSGDND